MEERTWEPFANLKENFPGIFKASRALLRKDVSNREFWTYFIDDILD